MLGSWYDPKRRKIAEGKILGGGRGPYKHLVGAALDPEVVQQWYCILERCLAAWQT